MSIAQDCDQKRTDIISRGKKIADEGAHYLWGAQGMVPQEVGDADKLDPSFVRFTRPSLDATDVPNMAYSLAMTDSDGVNNCCAGRVFAPDVKARGGKIVIPPPGTKQPTDAATLKPYKDFAATYASRLNMQSTYNGTALTPHFIMGDVMDYTKTPAVSLDGAVLWAEACANKLHFDCGGFVKWIVRDVCKSNVAGITGPWNKKNPTPLPTVMGKPAGRIIAEHELMLPADILVFNGHVAFSMAPAKTPFVAGSAYPVLQAESAVYGVNYGKSHGPAIGCVRLTPTALLHLVVPDGEQETVLLDTFKGSARPAVRSPFRL